MKLDYQTAPKSTREIATSLCLFISIAFMICQHILLRRSDSASIKSTITMSTWLGAAGIIAAGALSHWCWERRRWRGMILAVIAIAIFLLCILRAAWEALHRM